MRVTESLIRQNRMAKQKKSLQKEETETTMRYKEEKWKYWAMNQTGSVYESCFRKGINTADC